MLRVRADNHGASARRAGQTAFLRGGNRAGARAVGAALAPESRGAKSREPAARCRHDVGGWVADASSLGRLDSRRCPVRGASVPTGMVPETMRRTSRDDLAGPRAAESARASTRGAGVRRRGARSVTNRTDLNGDSYRPPASGGSHSRSALASISRGPHCTRDRRKGSTHGGIESQGPR